MALNIYKLPNENYKYTNLSPLTMTFDGRIGGAQDQCIYIRNDASDRYYESITLQAVSTETLLNWRFKEKDIPPTNDEWMEIAANNTLSLSVDVGNSSYADISSYIAVWVRLTMPRGQDIRTITSMTLRLNATEILI